MKIEFTITNNTVELLSNTNTGDNALIINGNTIPSSEWVGSGYYSYGNISIKKISDTSGNIFCNKISATEYELNRKSATTGGGHIILNDNGSAMPQRDKLQFENCDVTDDEVNNKTVVTASEGTSFVLANQTLTFSNNVATVSDNRVTSSTYATIYFYDGYLSSAVASGISVDTSSGVITFTATTQPSGDLKCDIVCSNGTGGGSISSLIAELRDDVDALDILMGSTSITVGDGTVTGGISTLDSRLGNPSSASAVTGADAFSKINKINNDLSAKVTFKTVNSLTFDSQHRAFYDPQFSDGNNNWIPISVLNSDALPYSVNFNWDHSTEIYCSYYSSQTVSTSVTIYYMHV